MTKALHATLLMLIAFLLMLMTICGATVSAKVLGTLYWMLVAWYWWSRAKEG